jgi:hypothetical protein
MSQHSLTKNLTVRISEADDQALTQYAAKMGETNRTKIVRKWICERAGLGPYLIGQELDVFREALREVRSVGINLNQLQHAVNSGKVRFPLPEDLQLLQTVLKETQDLRQELQAIIVRSRNRPE